MMNFIKEKKQCLFAGLYNGVHINLRKILCGISVASQESGCRSQEDDGAQPTGEGGDEVDGACQATEASQTRATVA